MPDSLKKTFIQDDDDQPTTLNLVPRKIDHGVEQPTSLTKEGTHVGDRKPVGETLRRSQSVDSISQMTIDLTHELSNLLAPLSGISHLLRIEFPEATEEQAELFQVLGTTSHQANKLIKQILTFTRSHSKTYKAIESTCLVREIETLVSAIFPDSISVETYLPSGLWNIEGDQDQLHQVLVNLCLNARDAMPNGGVLKLSAKNIQVDHSEAFGEAVGEAAEETEATFCNYVAIQVADTGEGIPSHLLDSIFTPFFTTRAAGEGAGLGLSTAADIINRHGGFIDVLTDATHISRTGTQFWIYLPAVT